MIHISIFASGNGSNAEAIGTFLKDKPEVKIEGIYTNNPKAFVLERARTLGVPAYVFNREEFYHSTKVVEQLQQNQTQLIVLAGFMWLVPPAFTQVFTIVNIHPALLPKYGGKGMYGHYVHREVLKNKEKQSGITIHYVNEAYDEGAIILQKSCEVYPDDTPETLANRIHTLEHKYYPATVLKIAQKMLPQANE